MKSGGESVYHLQSRWQLEGKSLRYYGLRNKERMFQNTLSLTAAERSIVEQLPCELSAAQKRDAARLLESGVIVPKEALREIPRSLEEARFCTTCVANDYILPGLEFDEHGQCPLCQTKEETRSLRSVVPVMNTFPRAKKARFDVAVFYTGGKDSTYLLYYLAKVKKLRVLALTWEIPYMSEHARKSIEGAKRSLPSVEFVSRRVADDDLRRIYRHLYAISSNTCACPSLAYVLFYPVLVAERIPYFIAGNEPAQLIGLYYNHMAPKLAYHFADNTVLNAFVNIGRVLTLRPPLKRGQFHTLATMKQLAYGDNPIKNVAGYSNTLVYNIVEAIHQVPSLLPPLRRAIRQSSRSGNIPAFVQVDLDEVSGGVYDWRKIKDTIVRECGWVPPREEAKGLHTSCQIEKCKEHSQFLRFYTMQSTMMPFSALEISLAVRDGQIAREDALEELRTSLGFTLDDIPECRIMKEYFEI